MFFYDFGLMAFPREVTSWRSAAIGSHAGLLETGALGISAMSSQSPLESVQPARSRLPVAEKLSPNCHEDPDKAGRFDRIDIWAVSKTGKLLAVSNTPENPAHRLAHHFFILTSSTIYSAFLQVGACRRFVPAVFSRGSSFSGKFCTCSSGTG